MSARARPRHPFTRSRGSHTQARDAAFAGTRHTPPTKTPTFPRQKAKKSPFQQHEMSYNPSFPHQYDEKSLQNQHVLSYNPQVGSHQLQYRLTRTNKPKSRYKTNTFCPITLTPGLHPERAP
ncbi:hypothetical protein HMPREF1980_01081 [Actinomyces sp. oral taxon 172 str. F0311]|nr:hypothetical protein HMPREF1980_01081 [Actinomyces sp. oral taxon 172 str. F0311]